MKKLFFVLRFIAIEFLIMPFTFCLHFFYRTPAWKNNNKQPILLVHGYCNNSMVWLFHGKRLSQKGFGPIYTVNLKNPLDSIKTHAEILDKKIKQIQKENGSKKITLIGHSMGGLVSSYYAMNMAEDSISDIITIASPLKGTKMAYLGLGQCAKEMRPDSSIIKNLKKQIHLEENINFYHIATKTDQLIVPYSSSIIKKDKSKHFILNYMGHASILYSRKVNDQIIKWLSADG